MSGTLRAGSAAAQNKVSGRKRAQGILCKETKRLIDDAWRRFWDRRGGIDGAGKVRHAED